ncbi:MAG: hypothetical protein MR727_05955 [Lentisphaeria bacterium]|nr:hypothetical protein [Lentisphaeria bacterium]
MKKAFLFVAAAVTLLIAGCSSPRVTDTKRSAVEQYLLAVTIERLSAHAGLEKYAGKKVYFDYSYLVTQDDKQYLQGRLEMIMARANSVVVAKQADADIMIQPLCGVLATDYDTILLGTPALPVPVPQTDLSIVIPEIPIFKLYNRRAYGRMAFNIFDAKTRKPLDTIPMINASTYFKNWIILLIPFKTYNFNMRDTKDTDIIFDL